MIHIAVVGGLREELLTLAQVAHEQLGAHVHFSLYDYMNEVEVPDVPYITTVLVESEAKMVAQATEAVASGQVDILMKGIISTRTVLKEVLKSDYELVTQPLLSHVALADIPSASRQLLISDAAMNIEPDVDSLIHITNNAITVAHSHGIKQPKVALLSSTEQVNSKMPSSLLAHEVSVYFKKRADAVVSGPLSLDLATSEDAVAHKNFDGSVAGNADVLIVPTIDVGNVLYKSLTVFAGATIGGMIVGTRMPIVLTSRSDSTESKLLALTLALDHISNKKEQS